MSAKIIDFPTKPVPVVSYDTYLAILFSNHSIRTERAGYDDEHRLVFTFKMDAKRWKTLQKKGELGHLYATDASNFVFRNINANITGSPTVGDADRASKGLKTIRIYWMLRNTGGK